METFRKVSPHQRFIIFFKSLILTIFISLLSVCYLNGQAVEDTVIVSTGWNMVGATITGTPPIIFRSEPPGIVISSFFGYNPGGGYQIRDTLKKGVGYWVKVSENGIIIFSTPGAPCPGTPTVEYGGKLYNTVGIGSQCWLKENLDIGTKINISTNQTDNPTIEKYCYNDNPSNCNTYGGLYQWNEAMQYSTTEGAQGICPPGWHIPTVAEFLTLKAVVSNNSNALKKIGEGTGAGEGTNTSGFSALLAGYGAGTSFTKLDSEGYFWFSREYTSELAYFVWLQNNDSIIYTGYVIDKNRAHSVRCIKD